MNDLIFFVHCHSGLDWVICLNLNIPQKVRFSFSNADSDNFYVQILTISKVPNRTFYSPSQAFFKILFKLTWYIQSHLCFHLIGICYSAVFSILAFICLVLKALFWVAFSNRNSVSLFRSPLYYNHLQFVWFIFWNLHSCLPIFDFCFLDFLLLSCNSLHKDLGCYT